MFNLNYIEHQMRVIQGYFEETLSAYEIADKTTPNRHWFLLKKKNPDFSKKKFNYFL